MTSRRVARRTSARCASGRGSEPVLGVVLAVVLLAWLAPVADRAHADELPEVAVADRTALGLGAAAALDPASPAFEGTGQRFVGPHLAFGLRQEGGFVPGGRGYHLATSVFGDVHPLADPKPLVSPFVGVAGAALYGGGDAAGAVGPEAGVALFLSDDVLLEARYQFRWASEQVGGLDREQHLAWLGVRFLLPPGADEELAQAEQAATRAEQAALAAEEAVARMEAATERLERAVDAYAAWFEQQLRKQ
ncbi:hypothetical protein K2Z84_27045 [Candidatus Binatia bacterium]|nr:hypothetical protein [Candidatus Binatia bacterium]